jgi:hypothetical protein
LHIPAAQAAATATIFGETAAMAAVTKKNTEYKN